jgi:organic hydroperoxide reductase OsmC/OhrA
VTWTGNTGSGTSTYTSYRREHTISAPAKAPISGSSDPAFRGDNTCYNPEELLLASASACHMLSYLHLCAVNKVVVVSYEDHPTGEMEERVGGPGAFVRIDLNPSLKITPGNDVHLAESLHERAHENCFIANSLKVPVFVQPTISIQAI